MEYLQYSPFVFNWPSEDCRAEQVVNSLDDVEGLTHPIVINSDTSQNGREGWTDIGDLYFGPQFATAQDLPPEPLPI